MTFSIDDLLWLLPIFLLLIILSRVTSASNKGGRTILFVVIGVGVISAIYYAKSTIVEDENIIANSENIGVIENPLPIHPDEFNEMLYKDWDYMAGVFFEKRFEKKNLPYENDTERIKEKVTGLHFFIDNPEHYRSKKLPEFSEQSWVWDDWQGHIFYVTIDKKQYEGFFDFIESVGAKKLLSKDYLNFDKFVNDDEIAFGYKEAVFIKKGFNEGVDGYKLIVIKNKMLEPANNQQ